MFFLLLICCIFCALYFFCFFIIIFHAVVDLLSRAGFFSMVVFLTIVLVSLFVIGLLPCCLPCVFFFFVFFPTVCNISIGTVPDLLLSCCRFFPAARPWLSLLVRTVLTDVSRFLAFLDFLCFSVSPVPRVLLLYTCSDRLVLVSAVVAAAIDFSDAGPVPVAPSAVAAVTLVLVVAIAAVFVSVAAVASHVSVALSGSLFLYSLVRIDSSFLVGCHRRSAGHIVAVVVSRIVLGVSLHPWCALLHALLRVLHLSRRSSAHIWRISASPFLLRIVACLFCFPVFFLVFLVVLVFPCIYCCFGYLVMYLFLSVVSILRARSGDNILHRMLVLSELVPCRPVLFPCPLLLVLRICIFCVLVVDPPH